MVIEIFILLAVLIALLLFIQKVVMKRRLQRGLGRKVEDHELTSLNSWMEATPGDPAKQQAAPANTPERTTER